VPNVSDRIIVLKKTKLGEMDLIITAFSESGQQVRAVIKGGRKPGSRRGSHLELFSETQVLLYHGRGALDTVSEAQLVDAHLGCRVDIEHSSAAAVVTELVEVLSRDAEADPRLYQMLGSALSCIENTPSGGLELIVAAAMLKIIGQVGFLPNLKSCTICGRLREAQSEPMEFSFEQGGVVCSECAISPDRLEDGVFSGMTDFSGAKNKSLTTPVYDWIELLIGSRFSELAACTGDENSGTGRMLLEFARDWMRTHVTQTNRSVDFLLALR